MNEFGKVEKKWQKAWAKAKIFQPKIDNKKKKFFFTVPFPYTSGPLHVGHGRTYCVADFVARFKRKQGYNVLWPMAFHISGTPILAISDRINKGDEKYIKMFRDYVSIYESSPAKVEKIIESFKNPQNVADYFASVISNDFDSIGLSIDWTRKFTSGDKEYNKFIEWQYEKFMNAGVLVQGSHPVTYCLECKNAAGEDDIKDGDTDKVKINEFTAIKYKLGDKYLVASSLRPETIYGITNLWVNPDKAYVEVELRHKEIIIISNEAFQKIEYQFKNLRKIREFLGSELVGKNVVTPLGSEVPVLPAEFVDVDTATGIVYSVPAHAPLDYVALRELQEDDSLIKKYGLDSGKIKSIKPVKIINIEGYSREPAVEVVEKLKIKSSTEKELIEQATKQVYRDEFYKGVLNDKCEEFAGLQISKIKNEIRGKLEAQHLAFTFYETSRKAECRCNGKVIVAVLDNQWFLDYTDEKWKEQARNLINEMKIYPEKYRKSFLDVIDWLTMRPCARRRGLGTRLPYDKDWVIESLSDSTIYMAFYLIINIIRGSKIKPEQLTKELFDYVLLGKGDAARISMETRITNSVVNALRTSFDYWYPVDQRHTAPGHISNHLIFFIMHHVKIFPKKDWPRAMTFNEFLTGREGVKMSKSRGNVIPLIDISRKYSADLYRLYVLSSTELDSKADWREADIMNIKNKLGSFAGIAAAAIKAKPAKKLANIDKWIVSRFYSRLSKAEKQGEGMQIRDYALNMFFELLNEVAHYRMRVDEKRISSVIKVFIKDWVIALEPIIPHICEEMWHKMEKGFVSLESFPKVNKKLIDKKIEQGETTVMNTMKDVNEVIKLVNKKPKKITILIPDKWKYELVKIIKGSENQHDIKTLTAEVMKNPEIKKNGGEAVKIIQSLVNNPAKLPEKYSTRDEEYAALSEASKFLEEEFSAEVDVVKDSTHPKIRNALPGKLGIIIE